MPVISEYFVAGAIARFGEQHPKTRFLLVATASPVVYERIAAQQVDIALAERGPSSHLVHEIPCQGDCLCALPAADRLASRESVTPVDLEERSCATFLPEHRIARELRRVFAEAGAWLDARYELEDAAAQSRRVAEGAAFGVLGPLDAWIYRHPQREANAIRFVPLRPAIAYRLAILAPAHRALSRPARAFQQTVRTALDAALSAGAER